MRISVVVLTSATISLIVSALYNHIIEYVQLGKLPLGEKSNKTMVQMLSSNNNHHPAGESEGSFFCEPKQRQDSLTPTGRAPVIIWAQARTGSTLLKDMMEIINSHISNEDFDFFNYHEFYNDKAASRPEVLKKRYADLLDDLKTSCKEKPGVEGEMWYKDQAEYLYNLRHTNTTKLFYSLSDMPTWSKKPFFGFKMTSWYLESMTRPQFMESLNKLQGIKKPKYVVLWRRRMIESFVSKEVARTTGIWGQMVGSEASGTSTSKPTTVKLRKNACKKYIQELKQYYSSVRDFLRTSGSDYMVLEYSKDMLEPSLHLKTFQKLIDFFELGSHNLDLQELSNQIHMEKQSQTPLSEQVKNWNEVVSWGYGGEVDEWPDLFA